MAAEVPIPKLPLLVKRKLLFPEVPIPTFPASPASSRIFPELYVCSVRLDELNVSPAVIYSGAALFMYEAVGLVKFISYAIDTSPGEVKFTGNDVVTAVSEIENIEDPESSILNKFPVVVPLLPILNAKRSPVAVVEDGGAQERCSKDPVPAVPEREVAADAIFSKVPVVKVLEERVLISTSFPEVIVWEYADKGAPGVVNPIPTLPVLVTTKLVEPLGFTWKSWEDEVVPIPTLPEEFIESPECDPPPVVRAI